jgi:hypothetical protein
MRWESLFDDLEAQLGDALESEERDLHLLRERQRQAALTLRDRLVDLARPENGQMRSFVLALRQGGRLRVCPLSFGKDWFAAALPDVPGDVQAIVPLAAVASIHLPASDGHVRGEGPGAAEAGASGRIRIADRIGLGIMLRDLARRRVSLDLVLAGETVHGTLDQVGADHLEVAAHDPDTARRASAVIDRRLIPLSAVEWVRL